jgi:hypothetical protein
MRRVLLLGAAVLCGACALAPGSSLAGAYQVSACTGTTPLVNNSWVPFNNNATYLETPANCVSNEITGFSHETSGLAAADVLGLSTNTPEGAAAGWTVAAPPGDAITAISMNRDLFDDGPGWLPQIVDAAGGPLPGDACPYDGNNGGCETSGAVTHTGLDTTSLTIEVLCSPASEGLTSCGGGASLHSARAELDDAVVTITDDQPPQVTSTSGELFTGGPVRGTIAGTVDGSDNSGVQSARLYVDGALSAQQQLACDYTRPAPCPAGSSNQFSLDTSTLANGPHQIQAAVVDAAGNQTLAGPVQITVENTAPITPPVSPSPPAPTTPSKPGKASPRLQILGVTRSRRALHVRGAAAKTLVGHVTIVVHYTLGGHSHSVQKTVRLVHGKWAAAIGLPGDAGPNRVSVLYRGAAGWLAQSVTRYVHHRGGAIAKNRQGGQGAIPRD